MKVTLKKINEVLNGDPISAPLDMELLLEGSDFSPDEIDHFLKLAKEKRATAEAREKKAGDGGDGGNGFKPAPERRQEQEHPHQEEQQQAPYQPLRP